MTELISCVPKCRKCYCFELDPVTQGVLGVTAAQSVTLRRHLVWASVCGLLSGLSPDLDFLIQSDADPLLYLEYHRQFSHSLLFVPFGGLACAGILHCVLLSKRLPFRYTYLYCVSGYATHGLLDACTTYGTQLFWPFSNARVAWHTVSIIDPLFTVPLLIFVVVAGLKKRPEFGRVALLWAVLYLGLGALQRERAEDVGEELAVSRGHIPIRLAAKPSFANLWLWKVIYETPDHYYIDAVRVTSSKKVIFGDSILKLDIGRDLPWLDAHSQQARDVERFRWFSNGYIALDPTRANFLMDVRYSLVPNRVSALWGIQLDPNASDDTHVRFLSTRQMTDEKVKSFKAMLFN